MPYSPSHRYVHVAIPKTGTTSLIRALSRLHRKHGGRLELFKEPVTPEFRRKHGLDEIGDRHPGYTKHLSAIQLKYILGVEQYDRCFSFSIVRNPWARLASRYFFTSTDNEPSEEEKRARNTGRKFHELSFEDWIERRWKRGGKKRRYRTQLGKLTDLDGRLIVDFVGRLETVQDSFRHICLQIGVAPFDMPHINGTRKGRYQQFYNDRTRDMVGEMCQVDIEHFSYTFESG